MYGRLSGLFRPDGYASRGIPLSQLLAMRRQGRRGDSMLAHVNPREAAVLRQMGGSGGLNPNTGLREFAPSSKTNREGGMGSKSGAGAGGVGGFGGGGTVDKGNVSKSAGAGNTGAVGGSATRRTGGLTGVKTGAEGGVSAGDIGKVSVAGTQAAGEAPSALGGALTGALEGASYGSALGPAGMLGGAVIGGLVGGGAFTDNTGSTSGYGGNPTTKMGDSAVKAGGGYGGGGPGAGAASGRGYDINDVLTGAAPPPIAPPPPPPVPNPNDPDPIVPEELLDFIEPGMTEEQIRAMIATYATNANNSYFQSPDVFDYYAGLLRPAVNAQGYGAVKPIEHQYLNQTFGLSYDPTVQALLTALGEAGLPDTPTAPPPSSGGNVRLPRGRRR